MKKLGMGCVGLILVLVVVRIGLGLYASSRFAKYIVAWTTDVKAERARAASVRRPVLHGLAPIDENVAPRYMKLYALAIPSAEVSIVASAMTGPTTTPEASKIVAQHRAELDALREAVRCTRCDWQVPWEQAVAAPIPSLLAARHLSNLLVLEARTLPPREAAERALDVIRMGSDFEVASTLLHRMIGIAILGNGLRALGATIVRAKPGELDLDAIADDLAKVEADRPTEADTIRGERLSIRSFVDPSGASPVKRPPDVLGGQVIVELGAIELDGLEREIEAALSLPPAERDKVLDAVDQKALASWNPLVKLAVPNFRDAILSMDEATTKVHVVQAAIALEKARGADGTYPASIAGIDSSVRYLRSSDGKGWTMSGGRLTLTR